MSARPGSRGGLQHYDGKPLAAVGGNSILQFSSRTSVAANTTRYLGAQQNAVASVSSYPITRNGTLQNLYCHAFAAPGAGETFVYTVFVNFIATAITCTTAGAVDTDSSDTVNTGVVAAGALVTVQVVTSLAADTGVKNCSLELS